MLRIVRFSVCLIDGFVECVVTLCLVDGLILGGNCSDFIIH